MPSACPLHNFSRSPPSKALRLSDNIDPSADSGPHSSGFAQNVNIPTDGRSEPHSLPLARRRPRKNTGSRSILEEIAVEKEHRSDSQVISDDAFPIDPQRLNGRREHSGKRDSRYPSLQTSLTDQVVLEENAVEPNATASPREIQSRRVMFGSPPRISLPSIPFPSLPSIDSATSPRRPDSPRSKSHSLEKVSTNIRRGRRSTSNSSSWSPASAFLSQWSRSNDATVIGPDDEGQEIGDVVKYVIGRQIGYGGFSVVKEAHTIENGDKVRRAVKIVRKHLDGKTAHENDILQLDFERETSIWRVLNHPYILSLIDVYEDSFATYCIMQYNAGGTLHDLVRTLRRRDSISRRSSISGVDGSSSASTSLSTSSTSTSASSGSTITIPSAQKYALKLPLANAKRYIYQLASALRYLHEDMQIVHRDVKLENCLLSISSSGNYNATVVDAPDNESGNILLCDFGMADYMDANPSPQRLSTSSITDTSTNLSGLSTSPPSASCATAAGSLQYAAPELLQHASLNSSYAPSVDMWAFGVVCYTLLTLKLPFDHEFQPKVKAQILKRECDFGLLREAVQEAVQEGRTRAGEEADDALQLVEGCLELEAGARWDIRRVLACGFLRGCAELYERDC